MKSLDAYKKKVAEIKVLKRELDKKKKEAQIIRAKIIFQAYHETMQKGGAR